MRPFAISILALLSAAALSACESEQTPPAYDTVIINGVLYDGSGAAGVATEIAVKDDRIAAIGDLDETQARAVIDAHGMAVAPGFINMLSWAPVTLIEDGRGLSDIKQGVTL